MAFEECHIAWIFLLHTHGTEEPVPMSSVLPARWQLDANACSASAQPLW